ARGGTALSAQFHERRRERASTTHRSWRTGADLSVRDLARAPGSSYSGARISLRARLPRRRRTGADPHRVRAAERGRPGVHAVGRGHRRAPGARGLGRGPRRLHRRPWRSARGDRPDERRSGPHEHIERASAVAVNTSSSRGAGPSPEGRDGTLPTLGLQAAPGVPERVAAKIADALPEQIYEVSGERWRVEVSEGE